MTEGNLAATIGKRSARLRPLVTFLLVALSLLLLLERFGAVTMQLYAEGPHGKPLRRLAFECVAASPEVCFLLALAGIRQALGAFAEHKFYAPTLIQMVGRVGIMLAAGGFLNVFLVPSAARMLGFGPGYVIAYDVSGLVLGAVGLWLKVIAQVMRRASQLQSELDEIF